MADNSTDYLQEKRPLNLVQYAPKDFPSYFDDGPASLLVYMNRFGFSYFAEILSSFSF